MWRRHSIGSLIRSIEPDMKDGGDINQKAAMSVYALNQGDDQIVKRRFEIEFVCRS